jgi:hypothetical protein
MLAADLDPWRAAWRGAEPRAGGRRCGKGDRLVSLLFLQCKYGLYGVQEPKELLDVRIPGQGLGRQLPPAVARCLPPVTNRHSTPYVIPAIVATVADVRATTPPRTEEQQGQAPPRC